MFHERVNDIGWIRLKTKTKIGSCLASERGRLYQWIKIHHKKSVFESSFSKKFASKVRSVKKFKFLHQKFVQWKKQQKKSECNEYTRMSVASSKLMRCLFVSICMSMFIYEKRERKMPIDDLEVRSAKL